MFDTAIERLHGELNAAAKAKLELERQLRVSKQETLEARSELGEIGRLAGKANIIGDSTVKAVIRLLDRNAALALHLDQQIEEASRLRDVTEMVKTDVDGVWLWQGDKHDDLKTLTCPVVMSASTARELLGKVVVTGEVLVSAPQKTTVFNPHGRRAYNRANEGRGGGRRDAVRGKELDYGED